MLRCVSCDLTPPSECGAKGATNHNRLPLRRMLHSLATKPVIARRRRVRDLVLCLLLLIAAGCLVQLFSTSLSSPGGSYAEAPATAAPTAASGKVPATKVCCLVHFDLDYVCITLLLPSFYLFNYCICKSASASCLLVQAACSHSAP